MLIECLETSQVLIYTFRLLSKHSLHLGSEIRSLKKTSLKKVYRNTLLRWLYGEDVLLKRIKETSLESKHASSVCLQISLQNIWGIFKRFKGNLYPLLSLHTLELKKLHKLIFPFLRKHLVVPMKGSICKYQVQTVCLILNLRPPERSFTKHCMHTKKTNIAIIILRPFI